MSASPEPSRSKRSSLASLFAIVIIDLIGFGIVIPILPFYAESFGANATLLGLMVTCYAGMQFLFAPVWGRWSDRVGRRRVMLFTIAGTALSLGLLGVAASLPWLFVARLLGGGFAANISVASAYITDATDEAERTKYMGLLGASFAVGFILGPALGGLLSPFGYGVPMLVAAGLAALNWIFAWARLEEPGGFEPSTQPRRRWAWPEGDIVRRLCVSNLVFTFAVSQLETVFAFFMLDRYGYDAMGVAFILVFMGLVMALVQGGGIRPLAKRFGERSLLIFGVVMLAPSVAVIPWAPGVAVMLIPLAVSSVARGLAHPSMMSLVSQAASAGERGMVMGTFQSAASLARMLGPLTAGLMYDAWGPSPFLLGGGLMLVVLALVVPLGIERVGAP
ncbi:MAG: MFS transporter [Acidobacteriota bacterium]